MVQQEVAERIVAKPNSKKYGRLSVMCQALSKVSLDFNVTNNVFIPKPNVNSSVLSFRPKKNNIDNIDKFTNIVKQSFSHRRKKMKNNISEIISKENLIKFGDKRAEELSINDFIKLSSN